MPRSHTQLGWLTAEGPSYGAKWSCAERGHVAAPLALAREVRVNVVAWRHPAGGREKRNLRRFLAPPSFFFVHLVKWAAVRLPVVGLEGRLRPEQQTVSHERRVGVRTGSSEGGRVVEPPWVV